MNDCGAEGPQKSGPREPAILPPGRCAQVNPLFRAAPSVDLLAGWHASKTGSGSSGRGGETSFFLSSVFLAQEISSTQTATVERNVPEPAVHLQPLPCLYASPGDHFYLSPPQQLHGQKEVGRGMCC